jgi:hypothetical protein
MKLMPHLTRKEHHKLVAAMLAVAAIGALYEVPASWTTLANLVINLFWLGEPEA